MAKKPTIVVSLLTQDNDYQVEQAASAEEAARKTVIKLIFPLVFFIFPALMVVILGPAMITLMHQLKLIK